ILDLMAGWDSHIPQNMKPSRVIGLGLNANELKKNRALTESVIHDLNTKPNLPFTDNSFDAVINTISVDYMTRPIEVFNEVGRILNPGGLFLVIFSNRLFEEKAVKIWHESSEDERILLVEEFFEVTDQFEKPNLFVSRNKPRPKNDKYAYLGIPSDPVYAVYADKRGGSRQKKARPFVEMDFGEIPDKKNLERRKKATRNTLRCPYCQDSLKKWAVPDNPFVQTWNNDFMYICFNDECPYFVRGWDRMYNETKQGMSYRLMYNPENDCCGPIPVLTPNSLKESIVG
ncbi:MAG: methyltransferase domain-containing protein, partial [Thermodesulfobacteriota bacterium]|nr:methyltransferase domain-containing protein [Thermodesulfobacteriota bacterium]